MIDTHCHLDAGEFDADRAAVIAAARAAGVSALIVPSVEVSGFEKVRACCRQHVGCYPAYGIHPLYAGAASGNDLSFLRQWLRGESGGAHPPRAVGEIGLDFFVPGQDLARQEQFFVEQLRIAAEFDLPVLLHVRRAVDPVLKHLRRSKVRRGIAHAFNGSRQQADMFLDMGFRLGFGGAVTYERATRLRALAAQLPAEAIVMETDAPDIPPHWLYATAEPRAAGQGQGRNEPGELPRIGAEVAQLRGVPPAAWAATTTGNALAALPGLQRLVRNP